MNKYFKWLLILFLLYLVLISVTGVFVDRGFYSQSYSVKFCSKHPINCINSLLSLSPKVKYYFESIDNGIIIRCIESPGVTCPQ